MGGKEDGTVVQSTKESGRNEMCRKEQKKIHNIKTALDKLHSTVFTTGKHTTGNCDYCGQGETTEHVLLHSQKYELER